MSEPRLPWKPHRVPAEPLTEEDLDRAFKLAVAQMKRRPRPPVKVVSTSGKPMGWA